MLLNLEVLNGEMTLKFDKYVNKYSVNISSDVDYLNLVYEVDEGSVSVYNNNDLKEGLNYVYIEVSNLDQKNIYTLEVYKEKVESVLFSENVNNSEIEIKEVSMRETYSIIGICFILIVISFLIIYKPFRKK